MSGRLERHDSLRLPAVKMRWREKLQTQRVKRALSFRWSRAFSGDALPVSPTHKGEAGPSEGLASVERALTYYRAILDKGVLELLPGTASRVLEAVWSLLSGLPPQPLSPEVAWRERRVYRSLTDLARCSDRLLVGGRPPEHSAALAVTQRVSDSLRELLRVMQKQEENAPPADDVDGRSLTAHGPDAAEPTLDRSATLPTQHSLSLGVLLETDVGPGPPPKPPRPRPPDFLSATALTVPSVSLFARRVAGHTALVPVATVLPMCRPVGGSLPRDGGAVSCSEAPCSTRCCTLPALLSKSPLVSPPPPASATPAVAAAAAMSPALAAAPLEMRGTWSRSEELLVSGADEPRSGAGVLALHTSIELLDLESDGCSMPEFLPPCDGCCTLPAWHRHHQQQEEEQGPLLLSEPVYPSYPRRRHRHNDDDHHHRDDLGATATLPMNRSRSGRPSVSPPPSPRHARRSEEGDRPPPAGTQCGGGDGGGEYDGGGGPLPPQLPQKKRRASDTGRASLPSALLLAPSGLAAAPPPAFFSSSSVLLAACREEEAEDPSSASSPPASTSEAALTPGIFTPLGQLAPQPPWELQQRQQQELFPHELSAEPAQQPPPLPQKKSKIQTYMQLLSDYALPVSSSAQLPPTPFAPFSPSSPLPSPLSSPSASPLFACSALPPALPPKRRQTMVIVTEVCPPVVPSERFVASGGRPFGDPDSPGTQAANDEVFTLEREEVTGESRALSVTDFTELHAGLVFKKEGEDGPSLRGGYVNSLLVYATVEGNAGFRDVFLMTYRSFLSPKELLQKLLLRLAKFCRASGAEELIGRDTLHMTLRVVQELRPRELSRELLSLLLEASCSLLSGGDLGGARRLRDAVLAKAEERRLEQAVPPASPLSARSVSSRKRTLLDFPSQELAEQLTLLDSQLFLKIQIPELLMWARDQAEEQSPNLAHFTEHFNAVSYWVRSIIIQHERAQDREKMLIKFVKILKCLRKLNNFNSYLAILSAADSVPIRRLDWHKQTRERLAEHTSIMDSSSSFRAYRAELADAQPPCIPYLGLVLQDLTFAHLGNPDTIDGKINVAKCWHQFSILSTVHRFQRCRYQLKRSETIIAFFNYFGDHLSEEALWELSVKIKPRKVAPRRSSSVREPARS
ncbi:uncharacterized protein LOC144733917 isoform X2 [Lampetra planeri]